MFSLCTFSVAVSGLAAVAQAVTLKDLPPPTRVGAVAKRDGYGAEYANLDLQSEESFVWGAADVSNGAVLGQLSVRMPGEQENIVSMERFKNMTTSLSCTNASMDITFKDDQTFEYAKSTWDWVNGADNHSFVMVAGTGDCGWNNWRVPFTVFEMQYDETANSAHLVANASEWKDAVHSYTLDVGKLSNPQGPAKRDDHDKDLSIDFNHQFPINYTSLSVPPIGFGVACSNCGTFGQFQVHAHLETEFGIPKDMTVGVTPQGVSMEIDPTLSLSVNLSPALSKEFELFAIPLAAIVIEGGILNIGLSIPVTVGVSMGPLQASGNLGGGLNIAIPDNATATIDVLHPDVEQSGWDPIVTTKDIVMDARLSGAVRAYINVGPALEITALSTGTKLAFTVGAMIQGKADAIASTGSACKNDPEQRHFGVDFNPTYGVIQNFALKDEVAGVAKTVLGEETGLWIQQLPILCYPFGDAGNITDSSTVTGDVPPPTSVPTGIATGSAASAYIASVTATEAPAETTTVSS